MIIDHHNYYNCNNNNNEMTHMESMNQGFHLRFIETMIITQKLILLCFE